MSTLTDIQKKWIPVIVRFAGWNDGCNYTDYEDLLELRRTLITANSVGISPRLRKLLNQNRSDMILEYRKREERTSINSTHENQLQSIFREIDKLLKTN